MESFISTMETMALMGMNVAKLVVDDFEEVLLDGKQGAQKVIMEQEVITPDEL